MSSIAFAQTQEKKEAYKFFEYEKISDDLLKEKFEQFYSEVKKDAVSQGYIINYGSAKEIAKREKKIRNLINFRDEVNPSKLFLIQVTTIERLKTIFWIVPEGAEPPKPE